jgi:hypothetical protein
MKMVPIDDDRINLRAGDIVEIHTGVTPSGPSPSPELLAKMFRDILGDQIIPLDPKVATDNCD